MARYETIPRAIWLTPRGEQEGPHPGGGHLLQMAVRAIFTQVTVRWRTLQEFQRAAWVAAARDSKTDSRLGQNGPLIGAQLLTKARPLTAGQTGR